MLNWFAELWNDLVQIFMSILLSIYDILIDTVCSVLDAILSFCVGVVSGLGGVFNSFGVLQYLNMLPQDMLNVMSLVGANEASAIIVSAVAIRFILQLIPFVRLGS